MIRIGIFGLLLSILAACTSHGEIDNPVQRRATWFSFISGEDIAASCEATGREQYRMTYITDRDIQVRIYDVDPNTSQSGDAQLRSRILTVAASDWFPLPIFEDPTRPFRPRDSVATMSDSDFAAFRESVVSDGWSSRPPPVGNKIASHSYSWLMAGCRDGVFSFQAWEYPDADFLALSFPEILFRNDSSDIEVYPHPEDGERRVYDRFTGRTGDNAPGDGKNLYNMIVGPRGVSIGN